jgi:hypothetical protein
MDKKLKFIILFLLSLLLAFNIIKEDHAMATDTQKEWGGKEFCSLLGDERKHFPLDLDIYTFKGTKGENVVVSLDADPPGSHTGERATLILVGKHFLKIDRSSLPNNISTVLPSSSDYFILVNEQFTSKWSRGFRGKYCLTLKSTGDGWQSLRPFNPANWSQYPITWIPDAVEQSIELGETSETTVNSKTGKPLV